jgi:hypothetical protein
MAKLHECAVHRLHPTQMTVGMIEVHDKRKHLRKLSHEERRDYLREHPIPAVLGPEDKLYLTDHHHLGRALHDEGIEHGFFLVEADFSMHAAAAFWPRMEAAHWAHPIDEHGQRRSSDLIPRHLEHLVDDPYRSLAGYVRNAGGYLKTAAAFAEFTWADFFRSRIARARLDQDFDAAVRRALELAHGSDAHGLPGYQASAHASGA